MVDLTAAGPFALFGADPSTYGLSFMEISCLQSLAVTDTSVLRIEIGDAAHGLAVS